MRLLRSIRKDLLWLNSLLPPVVKIGLLIVVIVIAVKAWWVGSAYWMEPVAGRWMTVPRPRVEVFGWCVGAVLITYIVYAIDRDRPR